MTGSKTNITPSDVSKTSLALKIALLFIDIMLLHQQHSSWTCFFLIMAKAIETFIVELYFIWCYTNGDSYNTCSAFNYNVVTST